MPTHKSERHEFNIVDFKNGDRGVRISIYMNRSLDKESKGFTDEEINKIKESEDRFIADIEKVVLK